MKFQLPLLLALATSLSAVPSDINYQGRLTDANGDAVTGDVTMSVKMYDAQSGGNEIYSEDLGTVTLDENGVYSFQFGASGNSTVTKTETIVTSDGTSTDYTGTFTSTPIDGTISVTDETYSWNDIDGNPGEQATAYIIIINGFVIFADIENGGSGYDDDNPPLVTITGDGSGATATATVEGGVITGIAITGSGLNYTEGDIIIAPPPAPFTVDKLDGNLEVGYASSPSSGTGVVATYKTLEPSIIGALSEASSHWIELTVDGNAQNPRERILSVPFAQVARALLGNSENDSLNYQFGSEDNPVTITEGEVMEINQLFSEGSYTYHTKITVDGRGLTTDMYNNLKLPFFIPGPATVRSNGYSSNKSHFVYRILNSNGSMKNITNTNDSNLNDSYENSTFSVIEGSFTWDEANLDAIQRGGRLAILDTQEKILEANSFLINNNHSNNNHFIGASDSNSEGNWVWVNGNAVTENNWAVNEPSNANNREHYAIISGGDLKWNDAAITATVNYLLELPNP
jgi:hypothetical protein